MIATSADVVATREQAARGGLPPLLVLDVVRDFLDAQGLGEGELDVTRIGDGQSNVTFLIARGERRFVLRRGPRPPLPASTHDMMREARIQRLLGERGVPVPRILATCEDDGLLGVPFYVMEYLDGEVVTDRLPDAFDSAEGRAALVDAAVDSLAALHSVDVTTGELAHFGRPDGYLQRQVSTFSRLWETGATRDIDDARWVSDWLGRNTPTRPAASVVHGDFRIGNVMFTPDPPPRTRAILDWEMAALGDPLADLGYFIATYATPGAVETPMELTPITREAGFPSRSDLIERYVRRHPDAAVEQLPWYQSLALFKAAVFCEAIYARWLNGERPGDAFAPQLERGVPTLLAEAVRSARGES